MLHGSSRKRRSSVVVYCALGHQGWKMVLVRRSTTARHHESPPSALLAGMVHPLLRPTLTPLLERVQQGLAGTMLEHFDLYGLVVGVFTRRIASTRLARHAEDPRTVESAPFASILMASAMREITFTAHGLLLVVKERRVIAAML